MLKTEIFQYQPVDAINMHFRDKDELQKILAINPLYFQQLPEACSGNIYSVVRNGKILIITGWTEDVYSRCASMILFVCEDLEKEFDAALLRAINQILDFAKLSYERIQATCIENKRNKRFLEFLGFKQECLMKKAGLDGADIYLYSIVDEEEK